MVKVNKLCQKSFPQHSEASVSKKLRLYGYLLSTSESCRVKEVKEVALQAEHLLCTLF